MPNKYKKKAPCGLFSFIEGIDFYSDFTYNMSISLTF